jgi:hypothetical protein
VMVEFGELAGNCVKGGLKGSQYGAVIGSQS